MLTSSPIINASPTLRVKISMAVTAYWAFACGDGPRSLARERSAAESRPHEVRNGGQCCIERRGIVATGLREVRPAPASASNLGRNRTGQLPCLDACGLVRRDTRHEHDLLRRLHGGEHDNRRLQTLLQAVHGTAQRTGICTFDLGCHDLHTLDIDRARSEIGALAGSQAVLESPDLLLHLPDALEHILHLVLHVFARAAHELGEVAQQAVVLLHVLDCGLARDRLDAAYARGNTAFTEDLEEADVSGPLHVSAAAELHREISNAQHANVLVVFLTEERHRAGGDRVLVS